MPTDAEALTPSSSKEERQSATSSCISQMASEHPDWDHERVVAACMNMARRATGHGDDGAGESRRAGT